MAALPSVFAHPPRRSLGVLAWLGTAIFAQILAGDGFLALGELQYVGAPGAALTLTAVTALLLLLAAGISLVGCFVVRATECTAGEASKSYRTFARLCVLVSLGAVAVIGGLLAVILHPGACHMESSQCEVAGYGTLFFGFFMAFETLVFAITCWILAGAWASRMVERPE